MLAPADTRAPMVPNRFRVAARHRETDDTVTLALDPIDGDQIEFRPGQFDMLYAFGVGEVPISMSGTSDGHLLHTVRAVGAVSRAICGAKVGDVLGVRGPFGTDWGLTAAEGADVVVVAGGIGLAPLRLAVEQILARRDRYGRLFVLIGTRSPEALVFKQDVSAWRSRLDADVWVTVDTSSQDWRGDVGVVTELIPRTKFDPSSAVALVCGPEIMMRFAANALTDEGVPAGRVRVSMERNMKCAIGHCGHCQFGADFVCKDGPVFSYDRVAPRLAMREF